MAVRVIFHIDINAFFASAHLIDNPNLIGKPVVVCRDVTGSVVTTASYEARSYGIQSAMPLSHAKRLCDDLRVVELDFNLYQELSSEFVSIIESYSPIVEQASIDEVYVDVTDLIMTYEKPLDLAVDIQKQVLEQLKLPISIGVAPNKFLAKMASDMKKPMGITVLRIREVQDKLWPLPISEMHGIGKKTVPRLKEIGVHTIGDLNDVSYDLLLSILGNRAKSFVDKANGIDPTPIVLDGLAKSIGQSKTFLNPIYDLEELKEKIMVEILEVERRAKIRDLMGKTIQFGIRMDNMESAARSITLDNFTNDREIILENVMSLYSEFEGEGGVTFISITLSGLRPSDEVVEQIDLFSVDKDLSTDDVIQELNNELNNNLFFKASKLMDGE